MANRDTVISAVIVSYNTREMTLRCLGTLVAELEAQDGGWEILVVDNASSDGSADAVRAGFPQVRVIESPANRGFGAANNLAMQQARGDYFLLINSDAFPEPGALREMLACARLHPDAGVVGPKLLNEDRSLQLSCFKFPSPARAWLENLWLAALMSRHPAIGDYRHWPHDAERTVDSVIGACMLVRREVYEAVGGFDERFFMYSEETDWQRRMAIGGWKVIFTPRAEVVHIAGGSAEGASARRNDHFFRSLDLYERKHHGRLGLVSLRLAMCVGCTVRWAGWAMLCLAPKTRRKALAKARLLGWLVVRQATSWKLTGQA